uniref:Neur_chan_LBD domain-containing protein n=1 Tax=Steinernema glaseri TaxID=37863 RepID=A0A1I8A1Z8_9BILA
MVHELLTYCRKWVPDMALKNVAYRTSLFPGNSLTLKAFNDVQSDGKIPLINKTTLEELDKEYSTLQVLPYPQKRGINTCGLHSVSA